MYKSGPPEPCVGIIRWEHAACACSEYDKVDAVMQRRTLVAVETAIPSTVSTGKLVYLAAEY